MIFAHILSFIFRSYEVFIKLWIRGEKRKKNETLSVVKWYNMYIEIGSMPLLILNFDCEQSSVYLPFLCRNDDGSGKRMKWLVMIFFENLKNI